MARGSNDSWLGEVGIEVAALVLAAGAWLLWTLFTGNKDFEFELKDARIETVADLETVCAQFNEQSFKLATVEGKKYVVKATCAEKNTHVPAVYKAPSL